MKPLKFIAICVACIILTACNAGSNMGNNMGNGSSATQYSIVDGVVIGNISTIPISGNETQSAVIVTNNLPNTVVLINATYTLYNSSLSTPQPTNSSSSPVNTTLCASITANGSCTVQVSAPINPGVEGAYLLTMYFNNITNGQNYSTSQLISYSATVPINSNGVYIATTNNIVYNGIGNSTTYSVPFVLTSPLNNISAASQNNNSSFIPRISCNGTAPYPAGTLCTLFIQIYTTAHTNITSGNIFVTSNANTTSPTQAQIMNIKGLTGYLFNVPVTVTHISTGNLVTSGNNILINPANGISTRTITLFNNGAGSISNIKIIGANPIVISSNTCGGTLTTGTSCTFAVSANQTINGTSSVTVTSNTNNGVSNTLTFNVSYIASTSSVGLSMATSGSLQNTTLNATNTLYVTVTNTGGTTLNNITFTPQSNFPSGMTYSNISSCATNGTQSLSAAQACTLIIQYLPTVLISASSFNLNETAQYTSSNGNTVSYTGASIAIAYSTNNNTMFAAMGDLGDLVTASALNINSWTTVTASDFGTITGLVNNGNLFFMSHNGTGYEFYSNNGNIFWNLGSNISGTTASAVSFLNGNYYITGGAALYQTNDPTNHHTTLTPVVTESTVFRALATPQTGVYMAAIGNGNLRTSTNGTTWGKPTMTGTQIYNSFAYNNAGSIAFAFTNNGRSSFASYANVSTAWTLSAQILTDQSSIISAVYNPSTSTYVMVTQSVGGSLCPGAGNYCTDIYSNPNPATTAYTLQFTTENSLLFTGITFGNGKYIMITNTGFIYFAASATPGTITRAATNTTSSLDYVYFDGTFFWAMGDNSTLATSQDGITWFPSSINGLTYNGSLFVAVGINGLIYTSPDLSTWTLESSGVTNGLNRVFCTSSACIAVGNGGTLITSQESNASTWNAPVSLSFTENLHDVTCGPSNCVAVADAGLIYQSPESNLVTWTLDSQLSLNNVTGVTYYYPNNNVGGIFVAVGSSGLIMTSSNGISWIIESAVTANTLRSVACQVGCVAVGDNGTIVTSFTGLTWFNQTSSSGTVNDLLDVAYVDGYFAAVGESGVVITSPDLFGSTWTTQTTSLIPALSLRAITAY